MMTNNEISQNEFERIEKYLLGEMEPEEKASFETELKTNESLNKATWDFKASLETVKLRGLRENLDEIHSKLQRKKPKSGGSVNWLALAASFTLLIAVGVWTFTNMSSPPQDKLFAQYVTKDPGLPVPMTGSLSDYIFHDAMVDYKAGKYEKAIEKWEGLLQDYNQPGILNYYLGSAQFNLENYTESITYFAAVKNTNIDRYQYKAQWYTVLAQLKLSEIKEILKTQPLQGSPYEKDIERIKRKLK